MARRAFGIWLLLLAVAFVNGALRQAILVHRYGNITGHQISTVLLIVSIVAVTWFSIGWIRPHSTRSTINIGLSWAALTMVFETGAGLVQHRPIMQILSDYDVTAHRGWVAILIVTALMPYIAHTFRKRTTAA
jgi:hypothetical protein